MAALPFPRLLRRIAPAIALALLPACTHLVIEDCGGKVFGEDEPRIRSSHLRMLLADLPAAADRFAPYAAMSALAYAEDADCGAKKPKLTGAERARLEASLKARGWVEVNNAKWQPPCEDDVGMFFRVWQREAGHDPSNRQVVLAFRGTWGFKDWFYGNFHWLTRFLPMDDQYVRARLAAQRVLAQFPSQANAPTRFYATGHSLGAGLAQHVLYSYPNQVSQAIAFDPSAVTGFADQPRENRLAGCRCNDVELNGEPRIYRVYEAYETLANLRIIHKTLLPPERHMQEVRIPNAGSHSMAGLAFYLLGKADSTARYSVPWYAGKGNYTANESCTAAFARRQKNSCAAVVAPDARTCPR